MDKLIVKIKAILILISLFWTNPRLAFAQLPRTSDVLTGPNSSFYSSQNIHLASIVGTILAWVFDVAGILAFVWAFIGVFQYLSAGGNKEGLSKARGRITWVFIGLLFLMISFALSHYINEVFHITTLNPPPISPF